MAKPIQLFSDKSSAEDRGVSIQSVLSLTVVAVLAVILLVILSAVRVVKLGKTAAKVDQLERELNRVHSRLTLLEKSSAEVHAEAPRADQPRPVTSPEMERVALHIRPVKPIPPPAVPPPPMQQAHIPTVLSPYRQEAVQPSQPSQAASENIPIVPSAAVARVQRTSPAAVPITADEAPTEKRRVSLEERLGQNWLNRLGIVALVTGLALLLGYKLRNLGPIGKSIMGFVSSGGWFRARNSTR